MIDTEKPKRLEKRGNKVRPGLKAMDAEDVQLLDSNYQASSVDYETIVDDATLTTRGATNLKQ